VRNDFIDIGKTVAVQQVYAAGSQAMGQGEG
jgi:hypothetical protein